MSPRVRLMLTAMVSNAAISFVLMFIVNYFVVPMATSVTRFAIDNGISGAIAGACSAAVTVLIVTKAIAKDGIAASAAIE